MKACRKPDFRETWTNRPLSRPSEFKRTSQSRHHCGFSTGGYGFLGRGCSAENLKLSEQQGPALSQAAPAEPSIETHQLLTLRIGPDYPNPRQQTLGAVNAMFAIATALDVKYQSCLLPVAVSQLLGTSRSCLDGYPDNSEMEKAEKRRCSCRSANESKIRALIGSWHRNDKPITCNTHRFSSSQAISI